MKVEKTPLEGVLLIEPSVFGDPRGFFMEAWQHEKYAEAGITDVFVQDNISYSRHGVLRGIHFQNPGQQGKLVYVVRGAVLDVAVDLRRGSPTFKQWFATELSFKNARQMYIPPGMGHGFCVLSKEAVFVYKCTEYYKREFERTLRWDDPSIGVEWPAGDHILSEKDANAPYLKDLPSDALPSYKR
jgi:dTDP-4-dehydrorhamnose 3,5-epimerase